MLRLEDATLRSGFVFGVTGKAGDCLWFTLALGFGILGNAGGGTIHDLDSDIALSVVLMCVHHVFSTFKVLHEEHQLIFLPLPTIPFLHFLRFVH